MPTRARPQQLTLTPQAGPQSPTQGCGPALGQHGAEDTHLPSRRAAPPSRAGGRGGGAGPSSHTPKGVRERGGGGNGATHTLQQTPPLRRHLAAAATSSFQPALLPPEQTNLPGRAAAPHSPAPFPSRREQRLQPTAASGGCPAHARGGWPRPLPVTPPNEEAAGAGARTGGSVGPAPPRRWGDVVRGWCPSRLGVFSAIVCNVLDLEGTAWFSGSTKAKYF